MKRIFGLALLLTFFSASSKAQLRVVDNGRVEIACSGDSTNVSRFAVGGGQSGFAASFKGNAFNSSGLYAEAGVTPNNSWMIGIKGSSYMYDNNLYKVGVYGYALQGANMGIGRSYGVYGVAGNATSGWNFGVCGIVQGNGYGTGVYGTSSSIILGVDGKYAGYFYGKTKVVGSLDVTGHINGMSLGTAPHSDDDLIIEGDSSYEGRLQGLQTISYYHTYGDNGVSVITGDTACNVQELSLIEKQKLERIHYGIKTEQLKEAFPELVYELEDGSEGINYMEMIPILVQTINELNQRINILEGKDVKKITAANYNRTEDGHFKVKSSSTSSETIVSYKIPSKSKSAEILVCDLSGQVKKTISVPNRNHDSIRFTTDGLNNGIYMYSLVVDGEVLATKRIVVRH